MILIEKVKSNLYVVVACLILSILPILIRSPYFLILLSIILCYSVYSLSWSVLASTGQVSLGHAVFLGTGAYASVILSRSYGIHPLLTMFIAPILPVALSLIIGSVCLRLRAWFLAIATFAFVPITQYVIASDGLRWLFNGWDGLPASTIVHIGDPYYYRALNYYVALIFMLIAFFLTYHFLRSKYGLAFSAIHEAEDASETLGIPVTNYKILSFVISAYLAGFAGALLVHGVYRYVTPDIFELTYSVWPLFYTLLGGVGTILGPVIGSFIGVLLQETLLRIIGGFVSLVIIGLILVLIIIFMPEGIYPLIRRRLLRPRG